MRIVEAKEKKNVDLSSLELPEVESHSRSRKFESPESLSGSALGTWSISEAVGVYLKQIFENKEAVLSKQEISLYEF